VNDFKHYRRECLKPLTTIEWKNREIFPLYYSWTKHNLHEGWECGFIWTTVIHDFDVCIGWNVRSNLKFHRDDGYAVNA
jgi:hypothetical protein